MLPTRKRIMACWCFLLAALIAFYVGAYFYLDTKYPISAKFIQMNLSSPSIASQSNVEEAKKDGYSEKEIAEYLAQRNLQTFQTYLKMIIRIELTIFVTSLLVGSGFIILKTSSKRCKEGITVNKCPFCAGEVQADAAKCKHCGEWLKETPNIQTYGPPVSESYSEHLPAKKPISNIPSWKEMSFTKLILYIILLPAVVILMDIILSITFSKLSKELFEFELRAIIYIFYFSLGIWIADFIYRLRKITLIIMLSFITLFVYRLLIAGIYNPAFIGQAMINTLEEGIIVYASLSLFGFFFRYFEPRFDYAEVKNTIEFTDPITKKKYDRGTCTKCNGITIVAKERDISFLGKSSEYFCDNCNRFLRGNPLNNIFLGLTESVSSLLFMISVGSNIQGMTSSYSSIFLLVLFVGIYDGIKRLSFGISGVKRSFK